jgi:iron(III) transport system substrate-binding protein
MKLHRLLRPSLALMAFFSLLATLPTGAMAQAASASTLTLYSARTEPLLKPLLQRFTQETGVEVRTLTDKEGPLLARLKAEGASTQADVLMTVDAGNLWNAAREGVLQAVESPVLQKNIPAHLRDPENRWFGLSLRARTLVYDSRKVQPAQLSTYEDLASPAWKGKLCLRSSKKVYNQSLVAGLMSRLGEARTEAVVRGWVANLATDVFSDDTSLIKAVAAGQCQVGLVNTYYLGRLLETEPALPVSLFWANQKTTGVHVNISGAGVTRHSKQPALAQKFIEWLSGPTAQLIYADANLEYPVNPAVQPDSLVKAWGTFKADSLNVSTLGSGQAAATALMDRAGYK